MGALKYGIDSVLLALAYLERIPGFEFKCTRKGHTSQFRFCTFVVDSYALIFPICIKSFLLTFHCMHLFVLNRYHAWWAGEISQDASNDPARSLSVTPLNIHACIFEGTSPRVASMKRV